MTPNWVPTVASALLWFLLSASVRGGCIDYDNFPEVLEVDTQNGQTTLTFAEDIVFAPVLLDVRIAGTEVTVDYAIGICGPGGGLPPGSAVGVGLGYLPPGVYQLLVRSGFTLNPTSFPYQARRNFVVLGGGPASVPSLDHRGLLVLALILASAGGLYFARTRA